MLGLIGVGLYQITKESGLTIEELLDELDIDVTPEMLADAAAGVAQIAFETAVLTVVSAGVGTSVKLAYEAYESSELIGVTMQVLDIAFPEWGLMSSINQASNALEAGIAKTEKLLETALVNTALTLTGADEFVIADGSDPDELGNLEAKGDNSVDLLWGRGTAHILGEGGNDWLVHTGFGEAQGGDGEDVLIGWEPEIRLAGDAINPNNPESPTATQEMRLTLDGGAGDDWVVALGGTGAIVVGGTGSDWLYNTSYKGQLYGGTLQGEVSGGGDGEMDVFWWSAGIVHHGR